MNRRIRGKINSGEVGALYDNGRKNKTTAKCKWVYTRNACRKNECVITDEENDILEIKNIATVPEYQGKGYARALIEFIVNNYREQYAILQVGTGDSPLTIPFYEKCGFHILYQISLQIITITQSTRAEYS